MGRPPKNMLADTHPELADLLVDQSLRHTLSTGSTKKVLWRCPDHLDDPRHVYASQVGNKTVAKNPLRCNICTGKHVVPGINDVATTHPEVAELIVDKTLTTTRTAASNKKTEFSCGNPNHDPWTSPMSNVAVQGTRCPQCAGRIAVGGADDLATTHPGLAAQLADPAQATRLKAGSGMTWWHCGNPLHPDWQASVYDRTRDIGCPACSGRVVVPGVTDLATTHPELAAQLRDQALATALTKGSDRVVEWVCTVNPSHVWSTSVSNRTSGSNCRICANRMIITGDNDLATTHPELAARLYDPRDGFTVSAGGATVLRWRCSTDPEHQWWSPPFRFLSPRPPGCPVCFNHRRSGPEAELVEIIRTLVPGEEIITSDRSLLPGRLELDIVIPGRHTAVEFNGVWWHCEAVVPDPNYHAAKSQLTDDAGHRLIHVWEDDWVDKRDIIVRGLAHRLGATERVLEVLPGADPAIAERVYARQLRVTEVDPATARAFWRDNHVQGPVGSTFYLGLVDQDDRVRALLGVGATNHGSRAAAEPGVWDVQRYATCGSVPGGFTRLLSHATRWLRRHGEQVHTWTSFSNDDVSEGGMYAATGFSVDKRQPPSYSYVGTRTGWTRTHRSHYTKQRFITDPDLIYRDNWTEHEAALANKLYRVYDAGKTRWVKHV